LEIGGVFSREGEHNIMGHMPSLKPRVVYMPKLPKLTRLTCM